MDDAPRVARPADARAGDTLFATPHATCIMLGAEDALPAGADVAVVLADGRRLAYAPTAPGPDAGALVAPDPFLRGNHFKPVHQSTRSLAALVSIAAGRRMEAGPESERVFVMLRGVGLVFLQNENTLRFEPGDAVLLPAGEPARVWAQGPEDALAVVLQPVAPTQGRRTLAGEVAKRRAGP